MITNYEKWQIKGLTKFIDKIIYTLKLIFMHLFKVNYNHNL